MTENDMDAWDTYLERCSPRAVRRVYRAARADGYMGNVAEFIKDWADEHNVTIDEGE